VNRCRSWGTWLVVGYITASAVGCALLKTPESQLFSRTGRYESASIEYRVGPSVPQAANSIDLVASQQKPTSPTAKVAGRQMLLVVRYPHPNGRAGFARAELLVEGNSASPQGGSKLPGWLDQARRFANEHMPGVSFGDGVEQALGLDLPAAELDGLIDQVQQPVQLLADEASTDRVHLLAQVNGRRLAERTAHVQQLDRLVERVRKEGTLISHRTISPSMPVEFAPPEMGSGNLTPAGLPVSATNFDVQPPPAVPPASSQVVPVSFAEPSITTRLPPVSGPN